MHQDSAPGKKSPKRRHRIRRFLTIVLVLFLGFIVFGAILNSLNDGSDDLVDVTDSDGFAFFWTEGEPMLFTIEDERTGMGIPGLVVSLGYHENLSALALTIVDPAGEYPTQFAIGVHPGSVGPAAIPDDSLSVTAASAGGFMQSSARAQSSSAPNAANPYEPTDDIKISPSKGQTVQAFFTEYADKVNIKGPALSQQVVGSMQASMKHLKHMQAMGDFVEFMSGDPVIQATGSAEVLTKLDEYMQDTTVTSAMALGLTWWTGVGGAAVGVDFVGKMGAATYAYESLALCNEVGKIPSLIRLGAWVGVICHDGEHGGAEFDPAVSLLFPSREDDDRNSESTPPPSGTVSSALFTRHPDETLSIRCVFIPGDDSSCPVPSGATRVNVSTEGYEEQSAEVDNSENGTMELDYIPRTIYSLDTPTTDGFAFLPGSSHQLFTVARDRDGEAVECNLIWIQSPDNGDPGTTTDAGGTVRVGESSGSVNVQARCDGVVSPPLAVWTEDESDEQVEEDPYADCYYEESDTEGVPDIGWVCPVG